MKLKLLTLAMVAVVAGAVVNVSMAQTTGMKQMAAASVGLDLDLNTFNDVTETSVSTKKPSAFGMSCSMLAKKLSKSNMSYTTDSKGRMALQGSSDTFVFTSFNQVQPEYSTAIAKLTTSNSTLSEPVVLIKSAKVPKEVKVSFGACVFTAVVKTKVPTPNMQ